MDRKSNVSMAVIRRLPKYQRYLRELMENDVDRISSKELSEKIGFTASQIRQDLNNFGDFGQQGYGYNVKDLYKEIGEKQLYEEELWSLVLDYNAGDVELYKELKSIYTEEEWLEKREIIFSKLSPYSGIDKLYEMEGLYDRLIDLVMSSYGLYMLMEYEEILKDIYTKELLKKYEYTVKDMATKTTSRTRYREIVSILRRMEKYPGGKELVLEITNDWKSRYKNRTAMMDELSKL